jgi:hypothetical protein
MRFTLKLKCTYISSKKSLEKTVILVTFRIGIVSFVCIYSRTRPSLFDLHNIFLQFKTERIAVLDMFLKDPSNETFRNVRIEPWPVIIFTHRH